MRHKIPPRERLTPPEDGDERVIRCFLFLPKVVDDEWRWLEFADIRQRFYVWMESSGWEDVSWED